MSTARTEIIAEVKKGTLLNAEINNLNINPYWSRQHSRNLNYHLFSHCAKNNSERFNRQFYSESVPLIFNKNRKSTDYQRLTYSFQT